jgi:Ca2+/H+ antiporter
MFRYASGESGGIGISTAESNLQLSRASSVVMLIAYIAYIFFQLKTHRELFESPDEEVINICSKVKIKTSLSQSTMEFIVINPFSLTCMHVKLTVNFIADRTRKMKNKAL